jgi:aminoglycoside phosphotransferase (APT) family kinase protein
MIPKPAAIRRAIVEPIRDRLVRRGRLLSGRWRARSDRRLLPAVLAAAGADVAGGSPVQVIRDMTTHGGLSMTLIRTAAGNEHLVKITGTADGRRTLRREACVLRALRSDPRLGGFSTLVPEPRAGGAIDGRAYAIQTAFDGRPASDLPDSTRRPLLSALTATIGELHLATARRVTVDGRLSSRWVGRRIELVRDLSRSAGTPTLPEALAELQRTMTADLIGRTVDTCWIHGDYWTGNILVAPTGAVCGIVDWDSARSRELAVNDLLHLIVSDRRLKRRLSWGVALAEYLTVPNPDVAERSRDDPASELSLRTSAALYWLLTIDSSHRRHPATVVSRSWVRANVLPVVEALR